MMHRLSSLVGLLLAALWPALSTARAADPIVLDLPLDCALGETCAIQQYVDHDASGAARDYQCGTLSYDGHNGTDFRLASRALQRAGVNVLAAADGLVLRLRANVEDAIIAPNGALPASDRMCGNGLIIAHRDGWERQYCHLAKDSLTVQPGQKVSAGTPLGRVGLSGATQFPHLHFTVRYHGEVVDPFAFAAPADSCGGGMPLWRQAWRAALAYRARSVLNAGFAAAAVSM
jgi:Peptidase family M23